MDTSVSGSESIPVFDDYDSSPTSSLNDQQVIAKELPEPVLNVDYNLQKMFCFLLHLPIWPFTRCNCLSCCTTLELPAMPFNPSYSGVELVWGTDIIFIPVQKDMKVKFIIWLSLLAWKNVNHPLLPRERYLYQWFTIHCFFPFHGGHISTREQTRSIPFSMDLWHRGAVECIVRCGFLGGVDNLVNTGYTVRELVCRRRLNDTQVRE
jgi:hypothetical protein